MENNEPQFPRSPVPGAQPVAPVTGIKKPIEMSFSDALKQVLDGKRITRLSWETNDIFGKMVNNELNIFIRGEFHSWTIVPGDITAEDWIVLPE